jgi:hypothetical protein
MMQTSSQHVISAAVPGPESVTRTLLPWANPAPAASSSRRWLSRWLLVALLGYFALFYPPSPAYGAAHLQEEPFVAQKIRYHLPEASEVFIVWGIREWDLVPEAQRPPGTVVKNQFMHTPMSRAGDSFIVTLQVPLSATVNYFFLITKTQSGKSVTIWDTNGISKPNYHTIAAPDTIAEVYPVVTFDPEASGGILDILWQWGWLALPAILLIGGIIWLHRRFRNPYLDF